MAIAGWRGSSKNPTFFGNRSQKTAVLFSRGAAVAVSRQSSGKKQHDSSLLDTKFTDYADTVDGD
jgi:hypothetical protein